MMQELKSLLIISEDADFPLFPVRHNRTHSQLSQAVAELSRTSYRYMKVTILSSRDHLCVNPAVLEANNSREKLHMCQARVKAKTCTFHSHSQHRHQQHLRRLHHHQ